MSIDKVATEASYAVNGVAFSFGVMTFNDWMMLLSMLFGLTTVIISWYYKKKEDKRQAEKHCVEMKSHQNNINQTQKSIDK